MRELFRNPEVKGTIKRLSMLFLFFSIIVYFFSTYELSRLNEVVVDQNAAIVGKIVLSHPELKDEIIPIITKGAEAQEIEKGRELLKEYGYDIKMPLSDQVVFKRSFTQFKLKYFFFSLLFLIPVLTVVSLEYRSLYKKVDMAAKNAEDVVEGVFNKLPEGSEGEFARLNHSFNMMAERLKYSLNNLKEDKLFLKNIISDISHQLKTPLSSLIMFNDLLLEGRIKEDEVKSIYTKCSLQLGRMEWLIYNLLRMARLEAGAIEFSKKSVRIFDCLNNASNSLKVKWEEKEQEVLVSGDKDIYFPLDEDWTQEAICNIVKNCIEHTCFGGKIEIKFEETPLFLNINIRDNGEGIDKKDLPHIFERFYRGSSSAKMESVGIGLSLSKLIIEGQGGNIKVWSEKGKGTEFSITFLKGII